MIRVPILRLDQGVKQTLGQGFVYNDLTKVFEFKTLELPWKNNQQRVSCIPEGRYVVIKDSTLTHDKCFRVLDVPGRDGILWHVGNFYDDILGCTLPGEGFTDIDNDGFLDVTYSTKTINLLWEILPDSFYCSYFSAPAPNEWSQQTRIPA